MKELGSAAVTRTPVLAVDRDERAFSGMGRRLYEIVVNTPPFFGGVRRRHYVFFEDCAAFYFVAHLVTESRTNRFRDHEYVGGGPRRRQLPCAQASAFRLLPVLPL